MVRADKPTGVELKGKPVLARVRSQPSLVDVARQAKVSISTVSRTINQTGKIGAETQEMIRGVMRDLGYKPNRVARRLRANPGNSRLLGLIIPNIRNPFFADLARGVEDTAYKNNFAVLLSNYDEDPARQQFYLDIMQSESVDGIILPPARENDLAIERVAKSGTPIVCVDRSVANWVVDQVQIDNRQGALAAVKHLITKGHRRIGIIAGPKNSSTGRDRLAGYMDAHAEAGLTVHSDLVRYGDFKSESGQMLATELLGLRNGPTALFVCNNLMTVGALETVYARRLAMPKDLALVGFDDLALAAVFNPPLTMVRQPAYDVGCCAADLLFKRLAEPGRPTMRITLQSELMVREST